MKARVFAGALILSAVCLACALYFHFEGVRGFFRTYKLPSETKLITYYSTSGRSPEFGYAVILHPRWTGTRTYVPTLFCNEHSDVHLNAEGVFVLGAPVSPRDPKRLVVFRDGGDFSILELQEDEIASVADPNLVSEIESTELWERVMQVIPKRSD